MINGSVGQPIDLAALHINCGNPNGDVVLTVDPTGESVTLVDDGAASDQAEDDGIYSGGGLLRPTGLSRSPFLTATQSQ